MNNQYIFVIFWKENLVKGVNYELKAYQPAMPPTLTLIPSIFIICVRQLLCLTVYKQYYTITT